LDHFRRSVDQLFDSAYGYRATPTGGSTSERPDWTFSPVLETAWDDSTLRLRAILPAVHQSDVNVSLQGNQLIINGERKMPEGFAKNAFTQLAYGKFQTAVSLPAGLDVERINCHLHDGVLDITIPVAEAMKPRQIPVEVAGQQKSIGA
jgi:HSP20 family protein